MEPGEVQGTGDWRSGSKQRVGFFDGVDVDVDVDELEGDEEEEEDVEDVVLVVVGLDVDVWKIVDGKLKT